MTRLPDHFWSSLALFLLPALSLVLPSGYSYGPALLILVSLFSIRVWWGKWQLPKEVWWMWISFALLALSWLIDNWISGERGSALEKPLKMLMTLPCLLYLTQRPPKARWLWHGVVIGAIGAAGIALYQASQLIYLVRTGEFRANGFTNAIQFGNIALLLGIISICGWKAAPSRRVLWRLWLITGFASGLLASLLSSSRGGWLSLALLALVGALSLVFKRRWHASIRLTVLCIAGTWIALQVPQLHLQKRITLAKAEVRAFQQQGKADTSVGARLQMWQFAWKLYREKPLLGWTQQGYMEKKQSSVAAKQLDPLLGEFNHPHNDALDAASKRGTVGLLILLLVYATPFILFLKSYSEADQSAHKAVCMAGMVMPIAYFGFGLTQAFLPHTSGIVIYVYASCLLATLCNDEHLKMRHHEKAQVHATVPTSGQAAQAKRDGSAR